MRCPLEGGAAVLTLALMSGQALAEPSRFELEPKLGYAGTFNTGLSPYGFFVGLGVRARPVSGLWIATSLSSYLGTRAAADGPGVTYRAQNRAYALAFDTSFRFALGRGWSFEPGVEVGAAFILGSTYVTPTRIEDHYLAGNVGPIVRLGVRLGRFALGVEGAALFVPSYVAAPIVRGSAFAILPF